MRLVTYDRRGHRRLGTILDGRVVDLPDAVGHPAFPTTLEAFVQRSRGTVLDAARAALQRDDAHEHVVDRARVLPPLFPRSLLLPVEPDTAPEGVPLAIGPSVVTADECDPQSLFIRAKVDGRELAKGNLNGAARSLFGLIAFASKGTTLERADAFALGPFPTHDGDPGRRLWPDATVELAAEGIGTLRNRLGPRT